MENANNKVLEELVRHQSKEDLWNEPPRMKEVKPSSFKILVEV